MEIYQFLYQLWRYKWVVLLFALVPSLIFGLVLYLLPRAYQAHLRYQVELDSVGLEKLTGRFYSGENISRLTGHLRTDAFEAIADTLEMAEDEATLREIIDIQVTPNYIDFANKQKLKLSLERSWADNVQKLEELTAEILLIRVQGSSPEEVRSLMRWVRDNYERALPLYEIRDALAEMLSGINEEMVSLDQGRAMLRLALTRSERILGRLREVKIESHALPGLEMNLTLTDPDKEIRFLPVALQIQFYEAEVARLTEIIAGNQRTYDYFVNVRDAFRPLYERLSHEREGFLILEEYMAYLEQIKPEMKTSEARDFLEGHAIEVDDFRYTRLPLAQNSRLTPLAKGTVGKTALCFIILLLVGVFAVSFWEYVNRVRDGH